MPMVVSRRIARTKRDVVDVLFDSMDPVGDLHAGATCQVKHPSRLVVTSSNATSHAYGYAVVELKATNRLANLLARMESEVGTTLRDA